MNGTEIGTEIGIFGRGRLADALEAEMRSVDAVPAWLVGRGEQPASPVEVAIDASVAGAVAGHLDWALDSGTGLVIAATGWQLPDLAARVGDRIGVVVAPNGSLTVALLTRLTGLLGAFARAHYGDAAGGCLLDHHHAAKADAPSGTALRLARAWRDGSGREIDVASLRAGHEVGKHVVTLDAPGEQLGLVHRARSRSPFARGLLRAAQWLVGRHGVFTLDDVARDTFAGSPLEALFPETSTETQWTSAPAELLETT